VYCHSDMTPRAARCSSERYPGAEARNPGLKDQTSEPPVAIN